VKYSVRRIRTYSTSPEVYIEEPAEFVANFGRTQIKGVRGISRNFAYEKQAGVEAHPQATGREIPFRHRDSTGQCCEVPGGNVKSR
jgi:hypothetical protein